MAALAAGCGDSASVDERQRAIEAAAGEYAQARSSGAPLEDGPCLANPLPDPSDWVVDIAHDPRTEADDDPANQCSAYRDGDASHFVELTPEGDLIRAE
jgi:hypothetical protein